MVDHGHLEPVEPHPRSELPGSLRRVTGEGAPKVENEGSCLCRRVACACSAGAVGSFITNHFCQKIRQVAVESKASAEEAAEWPRLAAG